MNNVKLLYMNPSIVDGLPGDVTWEFRECNTESHVTHYGIYTQGSGRFFIVSSSVIPVSEGCKIKDILVDETYTSLSDGKLRNILKDSMELNNVEGHIPLMFNKTNYRINTEDSSKQGIRQALNEWVDSLEFHGNMKDKKTYVHVSPFDILNDKTGLSQCTLTIQFNDTP